jgi:hypothetical protein
MGPTRVDADAPDPVDDEAELIVSAMRLVASGASRRTVVAGLRTTEAALDIAVRGATGLGVLVATIPRPDRSGLDVVVTRLASAVPR